MSSRILVSVVLPFSSKKDQHATPGTYCQIPSEGTVFGGRELSLLPSKFKGPMELSKSDAWGALSCRPGCSVLTIIVMQLS